MLETNAIIVEEPIQFTSRQSSDLERRPNIMDPEGGTTGGGENPEFKLPKISSLAVVIMTNGLLQVNFRLFQAHSGR